MNHEFLWRALEGALGEEKTAYLRSAPLSELTRIKTLPEAVSVHASAHHEKRAFWSAVGRAIATTNALTKSQTKTASVGDSEEARPVSYLRKVAKAQKVRILEERTTGADNIKVSSMRKEIDEDLFDTFIKQANVLAGVSKNPAARDLASSVIEGGKSFGANAVKGLGLGAGLAVPLAIAGDHVSENAAEEARNKALQTAAGVGGMALLGYGATKALGSPEDNHGKVAELMSTVYIDQFLEAFDQTEKVAEIREINRDYGVSLICDLEKNSTALPVEHLRFAEVTRPAEDSIDPLTYLQSL